MIIQNYIKINACLIKIRNNDFACADQESFVKRGPTLTTYLDDKGREDPNTTMIGPS